MSTQACYPGDQYPHYWYERYGSPRVPWPTYGTTTTTISAQISEDRIREIIREELTKALEALKDQK